MSLFLHELTHLLSSILVGFLVWKFWRRRILIFVAALLGGFFIDVDHFFDYFLAYGAKINWQYFFSGYHFLKNNQIIIPFHSWELFIVLLVIAFILPKSLENFKPFVMAFTIALLLHLLIDTYQNDMLFQSYSFFKRLSVDFKIEKLVSRPHFLQDEQLRKFLHFD